LNVSRRGQKPGLSHRRAKIQHSLVRIIKKYIRVVRFIRADLGEKEVDVFINFDFDVFQAEPTRLCNPPFDPTSEIEPAFTRR
jgi:hypothetical protein